jgi:hypothetical protein
MKGQIVYVKEATKNFNCYFVTTLHCQKESNGYFVTVNNCIKKISSLSYFNDHKIRTLITTVNTKNLSNALILAEVPCDGTKPVNLRILLYA